LSGAKLVNYEESQKSEGGSRKQGMMILIILQERIPDKVFELIRNKVYESFGDWNINITFAPILRGGAVVARWAHNPKVGGSNPPSATKKNSLAATAVRDFCFQTEQSSLE
jgi:hypothetical protein